MLRFGSKLFNSLSFVNTSRYGLNQSVSRACSGKIQGPIIGIDLGTTNSCVSVMEGTDPKVIANAEGARTTPSVVAFTDKGEVLVGDPARRQAVTNSENTIYASKRYIGRSFSDKEVQADIKSLPYKVVSNNGDCWFRARDKEYSPSQIAAFVLTKMKSTAEAYLGMKVKNAVVTVPAYFNDSQRSSTKNAGQIAGLDVARIINEPTAAALAFGLNKANQNKTLAVYDLGGGTFDISILEVNEGVCEVKSTNGDTHLGGEDFDTCLVRHLCDEFKKQFKTDAAQDRMALQRIREAAEKAKTELSFSSSTQINLPYLIGTNSFQYTMSRAKFEVLVEHLVKKTVEPCTKAIKDSGISVNEIDEVILVGGMTRMPKVQEVVSKIFGKQPSKGVNPDEAVAMGAAIQGGVLTGNISDLVLVDVTSLSLGVKTVGNIQVNIIDRNTNIPVSKSKIFTTSADNQETVEVEIYQGERSICHENFRLGQLVLSGITPMPRGQPMIEVAFDLDNNGMLQVNAKEKKSGVSAKAVLKQNPGGLTKEQLAKMAEEAEKHREADLKRVQVIEARNKLDSAVFEIERILKDEESKIDDATKDQAKSMLAEAQPMLGQDFDDGDAIRTHSGRIEDLLLRIKTQVNQKSENKTENSSENQNQDSNPSSSDESAPKN